MDNPVVDPAMTVGVIGLGAIGGMVSRRLLECGVPIRVFDIDTSAIDRLADLGAQRASSAAEAADADFLITSLPTDRHLTNVVLAEGVLQNLSPGTLVELSTTLPETIESIAEQAIGFGVRTVDAPFSGGTKEALSGDLIFYVGADDEALVSAASLLSLLGSIEHVGRVGQGKAMKLVNNVMSIGNMAVAAEAIELGNRMGLDRQRMFDIISHSGGSSAMFLKRMPRILKQDFSPSFSLGMSAKDVRLALDLAASRKLEMPVARGVRAILERGIDAGLEKLDLGSVVKVLQRETPQEEEDEQ
jgi:3-hydroxyisobutyrate dehydrogenase-like beta-hydroxyacid dehydrogenase